MADITSRYQGNVDDSGQVNWRGDQVSVPQGSQSIYQRSSVQMTELGSRKVVGDRVFRYAKAGGTLVAGEIVEGQHEVLTAITASATVVEGAKVIGLYGASAISSGTYADGYLLSQSGTAGNTGYTYKIKTNSAVSSAGYGNFTLYDPISHTVDTADEITIIQNPYIKCLQCTTGDGHFVVGVAPIEATTGDYFWLQTWGPCGMKSAAAAKGETLVADATGEAVVLDASSAGGDVFTIMGNAMQTMTGSQKGMVWLTIAP